MPDSAITDERDDRAKGAKKPKGCKNLWVTDE